MSPNGLSGKLFISPNVEGVLTVHRITLPMTLMILVSPFATI